MGCVNSQQATEVSKKGKKGKKKRQKKSAPSLHLSRTASEHAQSQAGVVPPRQSDELTDASVLADYAIKSPLGRSSPALPLPP